MVLSDTPLIWPALGALYSALAPWAEALLRFMVGMALVPHGLRMCLGYFKGTGIAISSVQGVAELFERRGYRPAWFWAYGVVLTQFVAGPCLAFGLFTRPMALPVFALLALSAYDHAKYDGYFWNKSGVEYPAMWAAGALYFLVNGGGEISVDRLVLGFEF
jgi:putative oxidoreductase